MYSMTIETKFNIGDTVFFIHKNEINRSKIQKIFLTIENPPINRTIQEYYEIDMVASKVNDIEIKMTIPVNKIFKTKEELIASL